jgi:hypothetical protein
MHILLVLLALASPSVAAFAIPQAPPIARTAHQPTLRVSLINTSGKPRQLLLKKGSVELPIGQRIDIDTVPGTILHIISDRDTTHSQSILVTDKDAMRLVPVS